MSEEIINTSSKGPTEEKVEPEVNKSLLRQNIMCNHCLFNCETYEKMKEHYKSDFHKYNLNRVTMNLAPVSYNDYITKKNNYLKLAEQMKKEKEEKSNTNPNGDYLFCEICQKKFLSKNKLNEHLKSKLHLKNEADHKLKKEEEISTSQPKKEDNVKDKTTLDDISICLFCNAKSENLEKNMFHMINVHRLDIPFLFCIKNYKGMLNLLAKKIFTYHACLTCDTQRFSTIKALQNHMIDKGHTSINHEDLDEFLFKYYDMKKLLKLKDPNFRKMKEFKILSLRVKIAKKLKEKDDDGNEWEDIEEEDDEDKEDKEEKKEPEKKEKPKRKKIITEEDEDFEPLTLPNGELLLEDGSVLGNKIYNIYYKQRIRLNKYENLQKELREQFKMKNNSKALRLARKKMSNKRHNEYIPIKGSNKANYEKANLLIQGKRVEL